MNLTITLAYTECGRNHSLYNLNGKSSENVLQTVCKWYQSKEEGLKCVEPGEQDAYRLRSVHLSCVHVYKNQPSLSVQTQWEK